MSHVEEAERPVAWTAIEREEPVFSQEGEQVGHVAEVLGTGDVGIFHGIVVKPHVVGHHIAVLAQDVGEITNRRVTLKIGRSAFETLPPYVEEQTFTLGIRGLFRHRPGWVHDHKGDL